MTPNPTAVERQIEQIIEAEVERAMAPYRALALPDHVLVEMEAVLRLGLSTHPDAKALVRSLATDPTVNRSDEIDWRAVEEELRKMREEPA